MSDKITRYKGFDIEFIKGDPIYDPECDHKIYIGKHPNYYRISNFKKFKYNSVTANTIEDAKLKIKTGYAKEILTKDFIQDLEYELKSAIIDKEVFEESLDESEKEIKKLEKKIEVLKNRG